MNDYAQMLARYNRIANERLYASCAELEPPEYRKQREGSFGSIHALLNHMLLADRIWVARFTKAGAETTPPLSSILFDDFHELREARTRQDEQIESFFLTTATDRRFWSAPITYVNSQGKRYNENATVATLHFFNHQAHHRGQIHVMLSQTSVRPPSLDLHRILNP